MNTKTNARIMAFGSLSMVALLGVSSAATISLQSNLGGRAQIEDNRNSNATTGDYEVGDSIGIEYFVTNFRDDRANLGDDGARNQQFVQVWAFDATADFVQDVAAGMGAKLAFNTGLMSEFVGSPSQTSVFLLGFEAATGGLTESSVGSALNSDMIESLGSFDPVPDQNIEMFMSNANLAGIQEGERVFFALDTINDLDDVNDAYKPGSITGDSNALDGITLSTTDAVPEPGLFGLASLSGLAGLFLGRRRR